MGDASLQELAFDHARLADALDATLIAGGVGRRERPGALVAAPPPVADERRLADFLARLGADVGVDVEAVEAEEDDLANVLGRLGPGLIELPAAGGWLAVAGARRGRILVVDPALVVHRVRLERLVAALRRAAEGPAATAAADAVVRIAGLTGRGAARARRALVDDALARTPVRGLWMCRLAAGASFAEQLRRAGIFRRLGFLAGAHLLASVILLAAWWLVGLVAFGGGASGWMSGWVVCLATLVAARALAGWLQGAIANELGALLRRRLLAGALALDPDHTKRDGLGRLYGKVLECEALESLGTAGGAQVVAAVVSLVPVPFALALGAGAGWHVALLGAWLGAVALVVRRQVAAHAAGAAARLGLTHTLVEYLVGHRTRQVQLPRERWHRSDDRALAAYVGISATYDGARLALLHLLARGWLVAGLAALIPAIASGVAPAALAVSIGGVLYAFGALEQLAGGTSRLAAAVDAWRRVAPIFGAAASPLEARVAGPEVLDGRPTPPPGAPILEASQVRFAHPGRGLLLDDVSLTIQVGERVLLEGPSGAGKSTLASLLAGQRRPSSGLVLLDQLDIETISPARWRRRVAFVPQFHDNHVVNETILFNLLMARGWPPRRQDIEDAERVCGALGLEPLLAAMPAGLLQIVGDSGWQLSHGERSRVFLARALLQDADVLILDESLAALDPELLGRVGGAILAEARTLVLIAHP